MTKTRNERGAVTNLRLFKRIIKEYYEQVYAHKLSILDEMGSFFESHNLLKYTQN